MFWVLSIHLHQFVLYVSVSISVNKLTTTTMGSRDYPHHTVAVRLTDVLQVSTAIYGVT